MTPRAPRRPARPLRPREQGVALLLVLTALTVLGIVVTEFSGTAQTHLSQGLNIRDEARATTLADTALILTRACLDPNALPAGMGQLLGQKLDLERLCNLLLSVLVKGRVDLPVGGLSIELAGIQGLGISKGEVDDIRMTPEESFIGLAGLYCKGRGTQAINCPTRNMARNQLRSLLCDPELAPAFEKEQADGHRYTPEEIITNLIDWVDADDNRLTWTQEGNLAEGTGEGEDSYYGRLENDRYMSKDAPFDSIEELRLIRGIDDRVFNYLKDKVSAHASGKIDVNKATAEVISSILWASSPLTTAMEGYFCGREIDDFAARNYYLGYARLIVAARTAKQNQPSSMLGKAFTNVQSFDQVAKNPIQTLRGLQLFGLPDDVTDEMVAARFGIHPDFYRLRLDGQIINWNMVMQSVTTQSDLFRLEVAGRVGNMSRRMRAVLKRDGQLVRTLYYRED